MTRQSSPRPLSIKLLVCFFYILPSIFWSLMEILPLGIQKVLRFPDWMQSPPHWSSLYFLGLIVFGPLSILIRFSYRIAPIVIGLGIWRLRESYRRFAIGLQIFTVVNDLLILISPITRSYFVSLAVRQGFELSTAHLLCLGTFAGSVVFSLISLAIVLLVLIRRKSSFIKSSEENRVASIF